MSKPNGSSKAPRAPTIIPASNVASPYKEGTRKAQEFAIYEKGGTRGDLLDAIRKLGVTDATAMTWYHYFAEVVKNGKERPRKPKPRAQASARL